MIDVKRLIIIFLIFAASVSTLTIGVSYFSSATPTINRQSATIMDSASGTSIPANAFLPPDASSNQTGGPNQITTDPQASSTNLTDGIANYLTQAVVSINPSGPLPTTDGQLSLASPNPSGVLSQFSGDPAIKNFQAPNWDTDISSLRLNIIPDASDEAKQAYGKAFAAIENKYFIQTDLSGLFNKGNGSGDELANAAYARQQLDGAIQAITNLSVPETLLPFHKSFLKLIVYERSALATLDIASIDPFKAELIMKANEQKYNAAAADLQTQLPKAQAFLQTAAPSAEEKNGIAVLFNKIFGVQEAHAQFFGGIVFDPTIFARIVWEFLQSILLQILKNQVVTLLQNKVLKLIQNSGNPKFIQSWSGFLANAFNSAAGSAIGEIVPGLCPNFSAPLSNWLKNFYPTAQVTPGGIALNGSPGTTCTLQGTIPNTTAYYNNFQQGGWDGFGALLAPNNNIYGALIQAHDSIASVAGAQQQAAQSKAIAGSGTLGQELCDNGNQPTAPGVICLDGEPLTTLPGKNLSDSLSRNLNSDIDLIVNANDITGLLATITGSLLQQVVQSGANGLLGASPAGTGVVPIIPPATQPVACSPKSQTGQKFVSVTWGATGGTANTNYAWNAPGGTPGVGSGSVFNSLYTISGVYSVTVTGSTGGSDSCTVSIP